MSVYQKIGLERKISSILLVDKDTYARLVSEDDTSYKFEFSFSLSLLNSNKKLSDYEKVRITVKRKSTDLSQNSLYSNTQRETSSKITNNLPYDPYVDIKPNNGIPRKKLTKKIADKVYSGLLMLRDLDRKEIFLEQIDVPITPQDVIAFSNMVQEVPELVATQYKPTRKSSRSNEILQKEVIDVNEPILLNYSTSRINPSNVLERINRELSSITFPIHDSDFSKLTSESHLDNPSKRISAISKGKTALYFDIVKYYLDDIPSSPEESNSTFYRINKTSKKPTSIKFSSRLNVKKDNKNQNLVVRFDLFRRGSNVAEESYSTNLYLPSHVESFSCLLSPPSVKVTKIPKGKNSYSLTSTSSDKNVGGFNVYIKSIMQDKTVSNYKFIGSLKSGTNHFLNFDSQSDLSIVRVVSLELDGKESHLFTDVVLGPGHKILGNLVILPSHFGNNQIRVDVLSVPDDTTHLSLYRRDCTDGPDCPFTLIGKLKIRPGNSNLAITDRTAQHSRIYEYYAVSLSLSKDTKEEIPCVSNYVIFKNTPNDSVEKAVSVKVSNVKITNNSNSFSITSTVSKSENERITETLKSQIGEMYQKYLDPSSNSSSPLGDVNGSFQYADLFFHEVVRTNIVTGERETFELIGDGEFIDGKNSQNTYNVKPIDKRHSYYYQVFTYRKNPLDLFKNFVARGQDEKGNEWFYLPYKWRNPATKRGKLYPDDKDGIPIIDAYENFTSESYGLTASLKINPEKKRTSLTQVNVDRMSSDIVKISWEIEDLNSERSVSFYDSYVVLKVVNGVRSFVGTTQKNYIFHKTTDEDYGSIYYIVVPITENIELDTPAFSNIMLFDLESTTKFINYIS